MIRYKYFAFVVVIFCLMVQCSNVPTSGEGVTAHIVINEFMVRNSNSSPFADCQGNHEDWLEIYNAGSEAVLLSNFYVSDDPDNPFRYRMTDTLLPSGGFYLLWGGNTQCEHNNHLGFNFSADPANNEKIIISNASKTVIDSYSYLDIPEAIEQDKSYGRYPDGSGSWKQQTTPTPGQSNGG